MFLHIVSTLLLLLPQHRPSKPSFNPWLAPPNNHEENR